MGTDSIFKDAAIHVNLCWMHIERRNGTSASKTSSSAKDRRISLSDMTRRLSRKDAGSKDILKLIG